MSVAPDQPSMRISATVIGAPDPSSLAGFYERLLGWNRFVDKPHWVMLRPPEGGPGLSFQLEKDHVRPVWPTVRGAQQVMLHLDIEVDELDSAMSWAIDCGATLAEHQAHESVRVMLDPAGHPFCLFLGRPSA